MSLSLLLLCLCSSVRFHTVFVFAPHPYNPLTKCIGINQQEKALTQKHACSSITQKILRCTLQIHFLTEQGRCLFKLNQQGNITPLPTGLVHSCLQLRCWKFTAGRLKQFSVFQYLYE